MRRPGDVPSRDAPYGLTAPRQATTRSPDPWQDTTCQGPHPLAAEPAEDFPGEMFRVLKDKEEKEFGGYRTRRLGLEAWERQQA